MTSQNRAYSDVPKFHVGVDCIIFAINQEKLNVLLVKRDFEPEKGKWSLIGGFVGNNESVDAAAERVLRDLTGLDNVFIRQLGAFGDINRDPGARVVSVAYFALLNMQDVDHAVVSAHKAEWVDVDNLPELGFDHPLMIRRTHSDASQDSYRLAGFQSSAGIFHHDATPDTCGDCHRERIG